MQTQERLTHNKALRLHNHKLFYHKHTFALQESFFKNPELLETLQFSVALEHLHSICENKFVSGTRFQGFCFQITLEI